MSSLSSYLPSYPRSQYFLMVSQTEHKIIILSLQTFNNNASPLSPTISLHTSYTPAKLNCHHAPNGSHIPPHLGLCSECSLCGVPPHHLHLHEVFTAPEILSQTYLLHEASTSSLYPSTIWMLPALTLTLHLLCSTYPICPII